MELFYKEYGQGYPTVILHGLYGCSDNWHSIANQLGETYHVIVPDLRNHGKSPHDTEHNYQLMTEDIKELITKLGIEKTNIIGHSMGGKLAMFFALKYPTLLNKLIIVDISPISSTQLTDPNSKTLFHLQLMDALTSLNLEQINTYREADKILANYTDNKRIRTFLLKNLKKVDKRFKWKFNLLSLKENLPNIMQEFNIEDFNESKILTPSLFLRGENSDYLPTKDFKQTKYIFPESKITSIPNAGHWLHAEQPKIFLNQVISFLNI